MKCSRCQEEADAGRAYLGGQVICNECIEKILDKFRHIYVCQIERTTSGDFCLSLDDIHWLVITPVSNGGYAGYFLRDLDRAIKEGSRKKEGIEEDG